MEKKIKTLKFETEKKEGGILNIKASISFEDLISYKEKALEKLKKEVEIDGFRKGNIPEDVLVGKVGQLGVLSEAANFAISDAYPQILEEEKLQPIGFPNISVTKLAQDNPLEFVITTTIYPEINLPDYKKIIGEIKKDKVSVSDDDVQKVVKNLLEMKKNQTDKNSGDQKEDEKNDKKEEKLTDEFVKTLGDFKNVEDFEKKLKEDILKQKEVEGVSKNREKIAEEIIKNIKVEIPEILLNSEIEKMIAQMKDDSAKIGLSFEDYLKKSEKSLEDLKKDFQPEAKKRAIFELALKEISKVEKISAKKEDVSKQTEMILSMHKDADAQNVSLYVENILINEEVMKFLETFQKS